MEENTNELFQYINVLLLKEYLSTKHSWSTLSRQM
jgi:hypothetical protein